MSTMIGIISIAVFSVMALYMFARARFMVTRRIAGLAAALAVGEMMMLGLLSGASNPAATAVLFGARVAMFVSCVLAVRRDREMAKARARRRSRFTVDMVNVMYPLRAVRRKNNAAQVDAVA